MIDELKKRTKENQYLILLIGEASKIKDKIPIDKSGYDKLEPAEHLKTSTQAVIAWKEDVKTMYVAFPGSQGSIDTRLDINIGFRSFNCKCWFLNKFIFRTSERIHAGFNKAFCSIKSELLNQMRNFGNPDRIEVTGHSLGGAIATIFATYIRGIYPDTEINLTTFGSPAVGNIYFVEKVENSISNIVRIVNKDDPVPYIFKSLIAYQHLNNLIEIDESGGTSSVTTSEMDTTFESGIALIKSILDKKTHPMHKLEEYYKRIGLL